MRASGLTLAGALAALTSLNAAEAPARPRAAVIAPSGVVVDVSRLKALGLGEYADVLQATVASELAAGLAWAPGSRVAIRLTGFSMNAYAGQSGGGGAGAGSTSGGGSDNDYLEGDIQVIGPRGEIVSERHQVVATPASSGGAYYLAGAERRRVEAAARVFAAWARRGG